MNFIEIEKEISAFGKKAKDGKLALEDMAGGTFTISNGGVFGSLYGTPIINLPQAAVLGMHAIKDRPVVVNGQIVVRPIMVVALTYDHRLLDGREAVTFLVKVRDYIEDPRKMLLA
jgi:2-oxoglutarate dehydrogenase E2 component (dihydrolipoamide succinyltransferase)